MSDKPDIRDRQEARRLRAGGLTLQEVGAELGISKQRVHQVLKTDPPIDWRARGPRRLVGSARGEAVEMYRRGMSYREIAATMGCSEKPVMDVVHEAGIARSRGRPRKALAEHEVSA